MTSSIYELKKIGKLDRPPEPQSLYSGLTSSSLTWRRRTWQNWVDENGRFLLQYAGTYVEEPSNDSPYWNLTDYYTRKQYTQQTFWELSDLADTLTEEWLRDHPPADPSPATEPESFDTAWVIVGGLIGGLALIGIGAAAIDYMITD